MLALLSAAAFLLLWTGSSSSGEGEEMGYLGQVRKAVGGVGSYVWAGDSGEVEREKEVEWVGMEKMQVSAERGRSERS